MEYIHTNEVTMDLGFREKVVNATGFCNRHMYLLYRYAFSGHGEDGLGYAMYAKDVICKMEKRLDDLRSTLQLATRRTKHRTVLTRGKALRTAIQKSVLHLQNAIQGSIIYPRCDILLGSDERRISIFLEMLEEDAFASLFLKSNGICLPHFVSAMESLQEGRVKSEKVGVVLMQVELESLKRINHLLGE